jgi:MFS family permease
MLECLFAFGEPFSIALFGRIPIGTGMSCALMGAMKVFTLNFSSQKFATLVGIFISIGTLDSVFATSALAYLNATIWWRTTFILAGAAIAFFALLASQALGERKRKDPHPPKAKIGIFQSRDCCHSGSSPYPSFLTHRQRVDGLLRQLSRYQG